MKKNPQTVKNRGGVVETHSPHTPLEESMTGNLFLVVAIVKNAERARFSLAHPKKKFGFVRHLGENLVV